MVGPEKQRPEALSNEALGELAIHVEQSEERFASARAKYQHCLAVRQATQASIEASKKPRNHIDNVALSQELDSVDAVIAQMEKDFFEGSAIHAINVEELEQGIKGRLN